MLFSREIVVIEVYLLELDHHTAGWLTGWMRSSGVQSMSKAVLIAYAHTFTHTKPQAHTEFN